MTQLKCEIKINHLRILCSCILNICHYEYSHLDYVYEQFLFSSFTLKNQILVFRFLRIHLVVSICFSFILENQLLISF